MQVLGYTPNKIEITKSVHKGLKGQVHAQFSASSLIKLLFSNLSLILSVNNPTHIYLSNLRVYFKVEVYFKVT